MKELSYHILDLVTNSLEAGAEHIKVCLSLEENAYFLEISDDGKGMPEEIMEKSLINGFSTKKGNSGQGLPLIKDLAEKTGGSISVKSKEGRGTKIKVVLVRNSPYMVPVGKIGDALSPLIPENAEITISVKSLKDSAEMNTAELKRESGLSPDSAETVYAVRNQINKNTDIFGGSEL